MNVLKKIPLQLLFGMVVVVSFYLFSALGQTADPNLHIYFLDVGQGDSIFVKTPKGRHLLVDAGEDGTVVPELSKTSAVLSKNIDLAFLTHPHADHLGGFLYLKDYYYVHKVIQMPIEYTSDVYLEWLRFLEDSSIPVESVVAGDEIRVEEDLTLEVLWPKNVEDLESLSLNNTSIVLMLEYKDFRALLMGDAEEEVEEYLLSQGEIDANLLKVGHHGSDSSSTEEFILGVLPEIAVICVGKDNKFNHPSDEVIERFENSGAAVYRTDVDGTIEVVSDGERFWRRE